MFHVEQFSFLNQAKVLNSLVKSRNYLPNLKEFSTAGVFSGHENRSRP